MRFGLSSVCPLSLAPTDVFPSCSPSSLLLGVLKSFSRCVRPLCHCWCPPFSAGHVENSVHLSPRSVAAGVHPFPLAMYVAFLFICLPGLSLVVSALFCWPCISIHLSARSSCSISIHLSPRSVTPFPLAFLFVCHVAYIICVCLSGLSLPVSALFRWPRSISIHLSVTAFICLPGGPGLSLLVSALFRWPCSISIHLSARSVTAGLPLAM